MGVVPVRSFAPGCQQWQILVKNATSGLAEGPNAHETIGGYQLELFGGFVVLTNTTAKKFDPEPGYGNR